MADLEFKAHVKVLLNEAPTPVRTFLLTKLDPVVRTLFAEHNLRVDQGAVLHRDLIMLLLGAREPEELVANLKGEAALDNATVQAIVKKVNDRIFIPIQQEIRAGSAPVRNAPQVGVPSYAAKPPAPSAAPRPQTGAGAPPPNLPGAMPDERLLPDHETPHINVPGSSPQPGVPRPPMPPPPPRPLQQPVPFRPTQTTPPSTPSTRPPAPPIPAPKPPPSREPYGADPYREPIDLS